MEEMAISEAKNLKFLENNLRKLREHVPRLHSRLMMESDES